jgi:hypothetical protein
VKVEERSRVLDWRSGGWLLLLMAVLVLAVVGWRVLPLLSTSSRAIGDGLHVESYGFSMAGLNVPRELVVAAGFPKDGMPALIGPGAMPGSGVVPLNESRRGKYLVTSDRVVGVILGGQARAYPVRLLNWHEVINDTLGGIPIAVTYHPLCDSVVVFDRRVGGETLEFGVSGLLFNSNQLLFDRRVEPTTESLWSQLLGRAVAGPAAEAGRTLDVLPSSVARWDRWLELYPETTVIDPDPDLVKRYERNPYGNYYLTGQPRFPVEPLPPEGEGKLMRPIVVVETEDDRWAYALPLDSASAGAWSEPLPGVRFLADTDGVTSTFVVEAEPGTRVYHSLWFAWYAHRPQTAFPDETSRF